MNVLTDYETVGKQLVDSILQGEQDVSNRTVLGASVPIKLFQSLRIIGLGVAMEDMVGPGARALVYQAGQRLAEQIGTALAQKAAGDLQVYLGLVGDVCVALSIGMLVIEKLDLENNVGTVRLDECVSCAGLTGAKAPICHFETGMVAGFFRAFNGVNVKAIETRCHALGHDTCGIELTFY